MTLEDFKEAIVALQRDAPKTREYTIYTGVGGMMSINLGVHFEILRQTGQLKDVKRGRLIYLQMGSSYSSKDCRYFTRVGYLSAVDEAGFCWKYVPGKGWESKPTGLTFGLANTEQWIRSKAYSQRFNVWEDLLSAKTPQ